MTNRMKGLKKPILGNHLVDMIVLVFMLALSLTLCGIFLYAYATFKGF